MYSRMPSMTGIDEFQLCLWILIVVRSTWTIVVGALMLMPTACYACSSQASLVPTGIMATTLEAEMQKLGSCRPWKVVNWLLVQTEPVLREPQR